MSVDRAGAESSQTQSFSEQFETLRQLNEQLTRSEARTRAIIDGIAEGVAVASKDGILEVINQAAGQILGVGLVETGQDEWSSVYGLYLPDGVTPCPTEQLPLVRAINGEHVEGISLVVRHPNHEHLVQLSVTASPFYNEDGQIEGGVAIFQDVTERLRGERLLKETRDQLELRVKELKASEQKYQDLYENAPDMYVTVDVATSRIVECNQTLATATGYHKHELVGRSVLDLHEPGCVKEVGEAFDSFRKTGEFPGGEFVLGCKDGRRIDVSLIVSGIVDFSGQLVLGRCVWRDITKRKRAEDSLARSRQKLAHLNRLHTAGEMATGLAHELNQPLNAIVNYSRGFIRRAKVGSTVTAELHIAAKELIREAERAASIIDGLRRLVARQSPKRMETDLNQVIKDAILICRGESQRHGITVEHHLHADLPPSVVDEVQIKQVIICLILNSIEALVEADVQSPRVEVASKYDPAGHILFEIDDNGLGIAPQDSEKVFEAFYTTKSGGMGMGLAICRSIVESHGGRVWNRVKPYGGTSFRVLMPVENRGQQE